MAVFCQDRYVLHDRELFHEGDEANALYILKDGALKISTQTSDGHVVVGIVSRPGDFVGEMALFEEPVTLARRYTATAIEDSHLIVIADYAIRELALKKPSVLRAIDRVMMERRKQNQHIEDRKDR